MTAMHFREQSDHVVKPLYVMITQAHFHDAELLGRYRCPYMNSKGYIGR